jgi:hypothetical protein
MKRAYEAPELSVMFIESADIMRESDIIELPIVPFGENYEEEW